MYIEPSIAAARGRRWLLIACVVGSALFTSVAGAQPSTAGWRAIVRQFAVEHFRHPAWGYSHSVRDYELAVALAREDKVAVDDDVLYAAAYLHDMAAFAPWDREKEGIDHADEGARVIDVVLSGTDFPIAKMEALRGAIRTHMFDRVPVGPEAIYLHDADALDWLGAIGIARVLALVDPNGADPDAPQVIKMLDENLAKVPQGVISPAAKHRVPALRQELAAFLGDLRRETDNLRTL